MTEIEFNYKVRQIHVLAFMEGYIHAKGKEGEKTVLKDVLEYFPDTMDQEIIYAVMEVYEKSK